MRQRGFIQLPLIGWAAIAAALALIGMMLALKVQTSRLDAEREAHAATKSEYAGFVAETKRLGDEARAKAAAEIKRQEQVNQQRKIGYEKRISDITAAYQRLLGKSSSAGAGGVPAVPDTARPTDGAACRDRLLEVLRHADLQTARLIELQEWVRQQSAPR